MIIQKLSDGTFRKKITDKEVIYNETPKIAVRVEKKKSGRPGESGFYVYVNNEYSDGFSYPDGDDKKETSAKNKALKIAKNLKAKITAKNIMTKLR